jgi:hypothetical protein
MVQWGAKGVVISAKGNYATAFFEAFPNDPATFIRGEGATVAEAEEKALARWRRHKACAGHEFERRGYRNGAGVCKHCGLFNSDAFEPEERCTVCGCPTYYTYGTDAEGVAHWYCEEHAGQRDRNLHPSPLDRLEMDEPENILGILDSKGG